MHRLQHMLLSRVAGNNNPIQAEMQHMHDLHMQTNASATYVSHLGPSTLALLWTVARALTDGKAVSPPSSVVFARYNSTVANLGESSTKES